MTSNGPSPGTPFTEVMLYTRAPLIEASESVQDVPKDAMGDAIDWALVVSSL